MIKINTITNDVPLCLYVIFDAVYIYTLYAAKCLVRDEAPNMKTGDVVMYSLVMAIAYLREQ
jgi:hypothetical protein